jgi:hypothetical protein
MVGMRQLPRDVQAQPQATLGSAGVLVQSGMPLEDPITLYGWDAGSPIFYG